MKRLIHLLGWDKPIEGPWFPNAGPILLFLLIIIVAFGIGMMLESGNPYKYGSSTGPCHDDPTVTCTYANPAP